MGRIKSLMIKKAAKQLLEGEHKFTSNFNENKKILPSSKMPSKSTRNKVVGYIAKMLKMKEMSVQREARRKKSMEARLAELEKSEKVRY